jgi:hypothetical protein
MAIGLSNHLKIGDAAQREHTANEVATIRTFWSLYFLDRLVFVYINLQLDEADQKTSFICFVQSRNTQAGMPVGDSVGC